MTDQPGIGVAVSSTGQAGTGAGYLSAHYETFRPEYEAMLRSVGIQPGWRVLDAGCGGGDFLPLLAELVGPNGAVSAIDLAEDNVATVCERVDGGALPCPVTVQQGSITTVPFPDATFDAVWCANTLMYLADDEVTAALGEFRRVTKPGGLVANKEIDTGLHLLAPAPPFLLAHFWEQRAAHTTFARGLLRARGLRTLQRRASLTETWQRTTVMERWSPLTPIARIFLAQTLGAFARVALAHAVGPLNRWTDERSLPPDELVAWQRLRDPDAPDFLLDDPDLYYCEANVVAVGRVPLDVA